MRSSYHHTGQLIHAHVLLHEERADHGARVIPKLSQALQTDERLLYRCLKFYRSFPILALRPELAWTHYRILIDVPDEKRRKALEQQAAKHGWTCGELEARVRAANATEDTDSALAAAKNVTPPRLLTPRRGTPGVCRVIDDGGRRAVDLGFACYLALPEEKGKARASALTHQAEDFVRVEADGVVAAKDATKADLFTYRAEVLKVVDGDTLWVRIYLRPDQWVKEKLRLRDLDCPEIATPEGKAAQRFTAALVARATAVTVCTTRPDKYDRYLADVYLALPEGEAYLNNELLSNAMGMLANWCSWASDLGRASESKERAQARCPTGRHFAVEVLGGDHIDPGAEAKRAQHPGAIRPFEAERANVGQSDPRHDFAQHDSVGRRIFAFQHRGFRPIHQRGQREPSLQVGVQLSCGELAGDGHARNLMLFGGPCPPGIFHESRSKRHSSRGFPARNAG